MMSCTACLLIRSTARATDFGRIGNRTSAGFVIRISLSTAQRIMCFRMPNFFFALSWLLIAQSCGMRLFLT